MKSLTTALTTMRRTPYQSLAAIIIVSITFFVGFTFSFFAFASEQVLKFFETKPQVIAFFTIDAPKEEIQAAAEKMKTKAYVQSVTIVSQEQALELYKTENQTDPLLLELVSAEILPASVEVSGKDLSSLSQIKQDLTSFAGIDEVELPEDILNSLSFWTKSLRNVGLGSIAVLSFESLLIILIVTSMKVSAKRQAISIMHLLGASNWLIAGPFVYEGLVYGLIGSLTGWTLSNILILYLTPWLKTFITPVPLFPIPLEFYLWQLGIGTALGIIFGSLASSNAARRMIGK